MEKERQPEISKGKQKKTENVGTRAEGSNDNSNICIKTLEFSVDVPKFEPKPGIDYSLRSLQEPLENNISEYASETDEAKNTSEEKEEPPRYDDSLITDHNIDDTTVDDSIWRNGCQKLFEKLLLKPSFRLIAIVLSESDPAITVPQIEEKLKNKIYASPTDFSYDIQYLINFCRKQPNDDKYCALIYDQLSLWVGSQISKIPMSKFDASKNVFHHLGSILRKASIAIAPFNRDPLSRPMQSKPSFYYEPNASRKMLNAIKKKLEKEKDVEMCSSVVRILRRHGIECEFGKTIILSEKSLTQSCLDDLYALMFSAQESEDD